MSTFFEKLTGAQTKIALPDTNNTAMPQRKETLSGNSLQQQTPQQVNPEESRKDLYGVKMEGKNILPEHTEEEGELTVDIYDQGDTIVIQSTVAGVAPENLDVVVATDNVLIRGNRTREERIDDKNFYCKELFWGSFSRSVILPEEINDELAEAAMKHGLLTIRLPKKKKGTTQKLKIRIT